jgi:hypothetical protein
MTRRPPKKMKGDGEGDDRVAAFFATKAESDAEAASDDFLFDFCAFDGDTMAMAALGKTPAVGAALDFISASVEFWLRLVAITTAVISDLRFTASLFVFLGDSELFRSRSGIAPARVVVACTFTSARAATYLVPLQVIAVPVLAMTVTVSGGGESFVVGTVTLSELELG